MSTDKIIEPYHRWAANEDIAVEPFSLRDKCRVCRVARYNPMSGERAVESNAVAAGPCPQRDWRGLDLTALRPYLLAYIDEPSTPAERAIYNELHQGKDQP